jgi:Na+-transporting NADH:ubiquinone oxidoreductase subunit NqrD
MRSTVATICGLLQFVAMLAAILYPHFTNSPTQRIINDLTMGQGQTANGIFLLAASAFIMVGIFASNADRPD